MQCSTWTLGGCVEEWYILLYSCEGASEPQEKYPCSLVPPLHIFMHLISFTRPSHALALQATNPGTKRLGYMAGVCVSTCNTQQLFLEWSCKFSLLTVLHLSHLAHYSDSWTIPTSIVTELLSVVLY